MTYDSNTATVTAPIGLLSRTSQILLLYHYLLYVSLALLSAALRVQAGLFHVTLVDFTFSREEREQKITATRAMASSITS